MSNGLKEIKIILIYKIEAKSLSNMMIYDELLNDLEALVNAANNI